MRVTRRRFLAGSAGAIAACGLAPGTSCGGADEKAMRLGLVTYLWGRDWDLPTLIGNCTKSGVLGVELRTTHAHGVEPSLDDAQRREVKRRFADSPVTLVGLGSDERFDSPDPQVVWRSMEATKAFVRLSHDVGGSGVKVKPDSFHEGVPRERTIDQIGRSLNMVGRYAAEFGQEIRLEVHGQCSPLPIIDQIMRIADHPSVGVCWNSNDADLQGGGIEANFALVKDRLGETVHVRELNIGAYPYGRLMELLQGIKYGGWVLLEARTNPADRVAALMEQREVFERLCGV